MSELTKENRLECEVVEPQGGEATHSVIWLHGLGADGHDFLPMASEFDMSDMYRVRFVFPHAPIRSVTINGGLKMRAWFDVVNFEFKSLDTAGLHQAQRALTDLIEAEHAKGIPYARIILAGFSQGGAVALHCALRFKAVLGGVIGLSTFAPRMETLEQERGCDNRLMPILLGHGRQDTIVGLELGEASRKAIESAGYEAIDWYTYEMAHSVCDQEVSDIRQWLIRVL